MEESVRVRGIGGRGVGEILVGWCTGDGTGKASIAQPNSDNSGIPWRRL